MHDHQSAKNVILSLGLSISTACLKLAAEERSSGHKKKAAGLKEAAAISNAEVAVRAECVGKPPTGFDLVANALDTTTAIGTALRVRRDEALKKHHPKRAAGFAAALEIAEAKGHEMVLDLRAGRVHFDDPIIKNERAVFDAIRRIGSDRGSDRDAGVLVDALRDLLSRDARMVAGARDGAKTVDTTAARAN